MGAPRNATAEIGSRRKYTERGVDYASVTTILSLGRPKEWMGGWAAKEVALTAEEGIERWGPLALEKWIDLDRELHAATVTHQRYHKNRCPHIPSALGYLKAAPWRKRDAARDAGTARHDTLEALAAERPIPDDAPGREQLETWRAGYRPRILESEAQVVNTRDMYAGSLDLIADVYGRRLVIDLKTSKRYDGSGRPKNPDRDWSLQLAAYRYAEYIFEDDRRWSMPETDAAAILWVPSDAPDEWMFVEMPAGAREYAAFLHAKGTHDDYREFEKATGGQIIVPQAAPEAA